MILKSSQMHFSVSFCIYSQKFYRDKLYLSLQVGEKCDMIAKTIAPKEAHYGSKKQPTPPEA